MNILNQFVQEYKDKYLKKEIKEDGLIGDIKNINEKLLDTSFYPSHQLKSILDKQIRRARHPMEVAITGQFSSGKSTFLNALLSKDILPTGITPVTSKVNFINYGEEYKLKITYFSGAQEYAPIDELEKFTDQRKSEINNIKYLTLYAPMEILKNISFVDTPGLNSQSHEDTNTTKSILRDVGGIIWLSLIDNAGKQSEADILDTFMEKFKNKSLCVLNQKDKFTQEQIETTQKYIQTKFSKYFSKVIPISAKLALQSRANQKDILLQQEKDIFLNELKNNIDINNLENEINNSLKNYSINIENIKNNDCTNNDDKLEESNIKEVINYIENTLRPQSLKAKEYAIKNDLKSVCDILIKEYETIIEVYNSLKNILLNSENSVLKNFDKIKDIYNLELNDIYISLESIIENTSQEIYKNISTKKENMYIKSDGFLNKDKFVKKEYDSYFINKDNIYKNLFYDDQIIDKKIKKLNKKFTSTQNSIENSYRNIFLDIKSSIEKWQKPYELIRKNREIASDIEFSYTRHFAAKVYENVTRHFNISILSSLASIKDKSSFFTSNINSTYTKNIQTTINTLEEQINESISLYQSEPTKFSIYFPNEDEIQKKLKVNFELEKIEQFLISRTNFLHKIIQNSKSEYLEINQDRIKFIDSKKEKYINKINKLINIKNNII